MMRISVTALAVMVVSLLIGQHWGLAGVTWGFAIGSVFTQLQQLKLALHHAQLSLTQFLRVLLPTAGCTLLAFAIAVGLRLLLPNWPQHLRLGVCLIASTLVYLVATWLFNRGPIIFLLSALRGIQPAANPISNESAS